MINTLNKILFLLNKKQKKQLFIIGFVLLIGILFEMLGIGIIFPALAILFKSDLSNEFPVLKPILSYWGNPSREKLIGFGMVFLSLIYVLKSLILVYSSWKQSSFLANVHQELSKRLYFGYLAMPYSFHINSNSSKLISNIQTEVGMFHNTSNAFLIISTEMTVVVGILTVLLFMNPILVLTLSFFLFFAVFIFIKGTKKKLSTWGKERQLYEAEVSKNLYQTLGGIKIISLMHVTDYFKSIFDDYNLKRSRLLAKTSTLQLVPRIYLELLIVMSIVLLVLITLWFRKSIIDLLPILGVFVVAAFRLMPSINRIMASLQILRYSLPIIDLIFEEVSKNEAANFISTPTNKEELTIFETISICNVYFNYNDNEVNVLSGITLNIQKGEYLGFVGTSGSGKSTLIDILLGLLTPTSGEILIGEKNLLECKSSWQKLIGYVPQNIHLNDDTIRRNIAFGIPDFQISDERVLQCLSDAQLLEFVNESKLGLDTNVGDQGVKLSGGQRQRIGIARALYHNPQILVFDEATSALDVNSEAGVIEAINKIKGDKTVIVVAHRFSTVMDCDRVCRFEKGQIIQIGKPDKVLENI